mgnify:CR=1 FL=1|jgi:hypothetical protein
MRIEKTILSRALCLAALAAPLLSCSMAKEEELMQELTRGYWQEETSQAQRLVRFSDSEQIFYYVCSGPDAAGGYDACYDTSIQTYTKYAIDFRNGRLCLLPDAWYDILVLNGSTLTLSGDDGENVKFMKIPAEAVRIISREEFLDKHPTSLPER